MRLKVRLPVFVKCRNASLIVKMAMLRSKATILTRDSRADDETQLADTVFQTHDSIMSFAYITASAQDNSES